METKPSRRIIFYILWGAILFSNFVFLGLVLGGLLQSGQSTQSEGLSLYGPIIFACITGLASLMIFIRATSSTRIKEMLQNLSLELPQAPNQTQQQRDQFEKLPIVEKKKILVEQRSFILLILAWVFTETVSVAGIYMIILGGPKDYFVYFSIAAVLIHIKNFPKAFFKVVDEVVR